MGLPCLDTFELGVAGRCDKLLSIYADSSSEHGPFMFDVRQTKLAAALGILPFILHDARAGHIDESMLVRLMKPIQYVLRDLVLEWLTESIMQGEFVFINSTIL